MKSELQAGLCVETLISSIKGTTNAVPVFNPAVFFFYRSRIQFRSPYARMRAVGKSEKNHRKLITKKERTFASRPKGRTKYEPVSAAKDEFWPNIHVRKMAGSHGT